MPNFRLFALVQNLLAYDHEPVVQNRIRQQCLSKFRRHFRLYSKQFLLVFFTFLKSKGREYMSTIVYDKREIIKKLRKKRYFNNIEYTINNQI